MDSDSAHGVRGPLFCMIQLLLCLSVPYKLVARLCPIIKCCIPALCVKHFAFPPFPSAITPKTAEQLSDHVHTKKVTVSVTDSLNAATVVETSWFYGCIIN